MEKTKKTKKRRKPRYTEKVHAYRVRVMLKRTDSCYCCPAARGFSTHKDAMPGELWSDEHSYPCRICQNFVGITHGCPCFNLGEALARQRTHEALKRGGYIK